MYDDIKSVGREGDCPAYETRRNHVITWNFLGVSHNLGSIPLWDSGTGNENQSFYTVHLVRLLAELS
jgi:hypothetical protein